jgi:transposase InsO family protein
MPSRGRTGTALDNAMAESVISTLKRELISRYRWPTRLDLELALVGYIGWYNSRRRHRSLRHQGKERIRRLAPAQMLTASRGQQIACFQETRPPRNPGRATPP